MKVVRLIDNDVALGEISPGTVFKYQGEFYLKGKMNPGDQPDINVVRLGDGQFRTLKSTTPVTVINGYFKETVEDRLYD